MLLSLTAICFTAAQGQVTDSITLQPINPAANGSACPGQNVTLNCIAVRTAQNVVTQTPTIIWFYQTSTSQTPNDIFSAVSITENLSVMSTITIFSVPLTHHNSVVRCETILRLTSASRMISVAGEFNYMHVL